MPDRDDQTQRGPGFSRRDFLRGSGAVMAATALAESAREAQAFPPPADPNVVAAGPTTIKLTVNGQERTVTVEPRTMLLEALRNDLNYTGCKDVCDTASCGACTVHVDGKAAFSCCIPAVSVVGKQIATVESLKQGDKVDPVVSGFVKHDAMQCGFCTPGFVMATRAFLNQNPNATLEEIQKGLGGNICRCGTYHGITQCALELCKKGGA